MYATQPRDRAEKMVAGRSTDDLVRDFELTDLLLLDRRTMAPLDDLAVCTTRGWIIDELVRRGEEARIGLVA